LRTRRCCETAGRLTAAGGPVHPPSAKTNGRPSVSTIKCVGAAVPAKLTIPAAVVRSYRLAKIKVYLFTGRNATDDAKMIALRP
jgi:hypothetical protein